MRPATSTPAPSWAWAKFFAGAMELGETEIQTR